MTSRPKIWLAGRQPRLRLADSGADLRLTDWKIGWWLVGWKLANSRSAKITVQSTDREDPNTDRQAVSVNGLDSKG